MAIIETEKVSFVVAGLIVVVETKTLDFSSCCNVQFEFYYCVGGNGVVKKEAFQVFPTMLKAVPSLDMLAPAGV